MRAAATPRHERVSGALNGHQGKDAAGKRQGKRRQGSGRPREGCPGRAVAVARSVRCRRQEDDQAGQEARLRDLRSAQRSAALRHHLARTDRGHHVDALRHGHQRLRGRRCRQRRREAGRGRRRDRQRTRRGHAEGRHRGQEIRARRAHRRSRPHVSARDGHRRAAVARGRNRHCQAHRGRPRGDDRGAVRKPADLPGHHHLARRTQRRKNLPSRHHRSRSDLRRSRRQEQHEPAAGGAGRPRRPAGPGRRQQWRAIAPRPSHVAPPAAPPAPTPFRAAPAARPAATPAKGSGRVRRRRRHGRRRVRKPDVARRHRGRAEAEGGRDLRQDRRRTTRSCAACRSRTSPTSCRTRRCRRRRSANTRS